MLSKKNSELTIPPLSCCRRLVTMVPYFERRRVLGGDGALLSTVTAQRAVYSMCTVRCVVRCLRSENRAALFSACEESSVCCLFVCKFLVSSFLHSSLCWLAE